MKSKRRAEAKVFENAAYSLRKCYFLFANQDAPVDDGNGVYHVSLKCQQVMECALEFQPSEVLLRALDFSRRDFSMNRKT